MRKDKLSFVIYISVFLTIMLPFSPAFSQEAICKENLQSSDCQKCIAAADSDSDSMVGLICFGDASAYERPSISGSFAIISPSVGEICSKIFSSQSCPADLNVYQECLSLVDQSSNTDKFEELWEKHEEEKRLSLDQLCAPDSLPWVQSELAVMQNDFGVFIPENSRRFDDCLGQMQSEHHQKIREFSEPGDNWSVVGHNQAVNLAESIDDIRARAILSEAFGFGNKITKLLGRVEADLAYCK